MDPQRLGRGLKKANKAVELARSGSVAPLKLRELLLDLKEGRVGDDGEDLNRKEGDLVVLFAGDEEGDLNDDFGVIEEALVDRVERLESA